ncbi:hypothetical protein EVAR_54161_1 [Eumeta japonica]|uniref:Uncharacterized protein n=1 Tax=Eumeta variegata TaxID=151549 RepID=A0A4C1Y303_EUMVA|nr:hypothetical protein EVAR_54161_1 [Eumeta japonica]
MALEPCNKHGPMCSWSEPHTALEGSRSGPSLYSVRSRDVRLRFWFLTVKKNPRAAFNDPRSPELPASGLRPLF